MSLREIMEESGQENGIEIWRIEKFELVPVPRKCYGQFYSGDTYVILYTFEEIPKGQDEPVKRQNLHFWIGDESSQDEYGSAAFIVVQMDDYHDGLPVQYREVENGESKLFRSYFNEKSEELGTRKMTYKKGGVESGFHHQEVNGDDSLRLLRIKGKGNNVFCKEVDFSWDSVTCDDVYIFEIGSDIYRWKGDSANMFEWLQSDYLSKSIRDDEQAGRGEIHDLAGGDEGFWPGEILEVLPSPPRHFPKSSIKDTDIAAITLDDNADKEDGHEPVLFKVSTDTGDLVVEQVAKGRQIDKEVMSNSDCYILDCGDKSRDGGDIFIWKGSESSIDERKSCMKTAVKFVNMNHYGKGCSISVFIEGCESEFFMQHFDWYKE